MRWIVLLILIAACEGLAVSFSPEGGLEQHLVAAAALAIVAFVVDALDGSLFRERQERQGALAILIALYLTHAGYLGVSYYNVALRDWDYTVSVEPLHREPFEGATGIRLSFTFSEKVDGMFKIHAPMIYLKRAGEAGGRTWNSLAALRSVEYSQNGAVPAQDSRVSFDVYEDKTSGFLRGVKHCRGERDLKNLEKEEALPLPSSVDFDVSSWQWSVLLFDGARPGSRTGKRSMHKSLQEKLEQDETFKGLLPQLAAASRQLMPDNLERIGFYVCDADNKHIKNLTCYCRESAEEKNEVK